jgi:hypothetical protein
MTVKELIDVFFNFNPDSEVYIKYLGDDYYKIEKDRINSISIDVNSNNIYLSSLDEG